MKLNLLIALKYIKLNMTITVPLVQVCKYINVNSLREPAHTSI